MKNQGSLYRGHAGRQWRSEIALAVDQTSTFGNDKTHARLPIN